MIALSVLRVSLVALGLTALAIALSNFLFGVAFTADWFARLLSFLGTAPGGFAALADASVDAEFRFFAVFWGVYGAALIAAGLEARRALRYAPALAGLFLLGGVGRALSYAMVGTPDHLFVVLMISEFVISAVMVAAWAIARRGLV